MSAMTATKPRRTYITKVHKSLAEKIGEEGADTLTNYLEEVIPAQIEDKVQYLATKEDVANVRADLKEDIASVRADLGKVEAQIQHLATKEDVAKVEVKVAQLETQISQVRGELKEDIAKVSANLAKWMLATIITIALGVLALFLKK